jgi:hypothetical protein
MCADTIPFGINGWQPPEAWEQQKMRDIGCIYGERWWTIPSMESDINKIIRAQSTYNKYRNDPKDHND